MKILYVTTIGITMTFFKSLIKELLDEGHIVDIICNEQDEKVPECYREWGCKVYHHTCSRSPFSKGNIDAIGQIKKLVEENDYDIVHCHTPIAAACTRLACRKLRKKLMTKVFYTAHGFHFYKGAPIQNWLIFYPIEKLCSYFTDVLITINHEDYELAKKKMKAKKVEYVPGVGIDVDKFKNTVVDRAEKRREIGVPEDCFLLMSVGELNENKNHQVIIKAMAQIENNNIHYIIAGVGHLDKYLMELAEKLKIADRVHLLGYRTDVVELYKAADVCCFPSIREGLGLAAIEGIAAGVPLICAKNRGTLCYADNNITAKVCANINDYRSAIVELYLNIDVREKLVKKGAEVLKQYDIHYINHRMKLLLKD